MRIKSTPYDDPPYSEEEPAFLEEWLEADSAVELLGLTAVAMLSEALKLYFSSLERELGFTFDNRAQAFRQGWAPTYKAALGEILQTDWTDCPASFDLIEQIVLARNISQHGGHLAHFQFEHDRNTLKKFPRPYFASDTELKVWSERSEGGAEFLFPPRLQVTAEQLFSACDCADQLAIWIEGRMPIGHTWRQRKPDA